MKRTVMITVVTAATVAAAAAVWLWALRPLGFASYLTSTGATDVEIIRQYWPHRLIQQEWIPTTADGSDRLMRWHLSETVARLTSVIVLWLVTAGGAVYRFVHGGKRPANNSIKMNRHSTGPVDGGRRF
jgi:hypothetical protein